MSDANLSSTPKPHRRLQSPSTARNTSPANRPQHHRSPALHSGQKSRAKTARTKTASDEEQLLVHGARDAFMAILRERKQVEVEAAMPRPEVPRMKSQGVQDADTLLNLLKIPAEQRTSADLTNICNQIRYSGIFQQLYISPDAETFLSRILDYRNFFHKGATVVHENCKNGSYFFILQGTLVALPSRSTGAQEAQEATKECYVLVVTVSEAMGIAPRRCRMWDGGSMGKVR